ncbi:hypothetical protein Tco_1014039 [Tanacetum coccineum]
MLLRQNKELVDVVFMNSRVVYSRSGVGKGRTCSPLSFLEAQVQFDQALRASLKKVVTASGSGFGDWKWRLATLPIKLGGLGILSAGDIIWFAVPMFSKGNLCPSCNAHWMDQWRHHAVHCFSEVGVKFRNYLVCDMLDDICSMVGIMVCKEAPMGFLSEEGKDLRLADLLLFNWLQGKDPCLDLTGISPFVGMGATSWAPEMLGEYIINDPLTPLVKPGGGIRPIDVGTVWRRLVFKVSAIMIGHSLDGYLDGLQFGVGVAGGSEAILHSVNRLIEAYGDDVGLSMLLMDFKNAFNLVDREVMLREVRLCCPAISSWVEFFLHPLICKIRYSYIFSLHAWYLDYGTIVGDAVVVGKVLELIMEDGLGCGLHLNVDKLKFFLPKEDPRSRLAGIFPPNIALPLHGVKLLGGPASVDFDFCNELVMKRVAKTIRLMDAIAKINDP